MNKADCKHQGGGCPCYQPAGSYDMYKNEGYACGLSQNFCYILYMLNKRDRANVKRTIQILLHNKKYVPYKAYYLIKRIQQNLLHIHTVRRDGINFATYGLKEE